MSHPFSDIKRRHKDPPTVRHINNEKKSPNWSQWLYNYSYITKKTFKSNGNNQGYAARAQDYSCCLTFSVYIQVLRLTSSYI